MSTYRPTGATVMVGYRHCCDHGFCTVCGGVWPCSRADAEPSTPVVPVSRLATWPAF